MGVRREVEDGAVWCHLLGVALVDLATVALQSILKTVAFKASQFQQTSTYVGKVINTERHVVSTGGGVTDVALDDAGARNVGVTAIIQQICKRNNDTKHNPD